MLVEIYQRENYFAAMGISKNKLYLQPERKWRGSSPDSYWDV